MLTVSDNHIVLGGGGGGGGSSTFAGLSDKATADLPGTNTPLANALGDKEATSNKKTDVDAHKTSDTFFPSVKSVFDWVSGLFVKGAASSTDNAIARFDGTTGKVIQDSGVTIDDTGNVTVIGQVSSNNGRCVIRDDSIENHQTAAEASIAVNVLGYNQSTGYYRNFLIFNGKGGIIASFKGAERRLGILTPTPEYPLDVAGKAAVRGDFKVYAQIVDNAGNAGADGQVLKKVGGLVLWANP